MNNHYSLVEQANVQILSVTSLLDEWENRHLLRDVQHRIDDGANLFIVDLHDLELINSVGLNFLLSVLSRINTINGQLILINAQEQVHNLLEITKLLGVFELQSSIEDAMLSIERGMAYA